MSELQEARAEVLSGMERIIGPEHAPAFLERLEKFIDARVAVALSASDVPSPGDCYVPSEPQPGRYDGTADRYNPHEDLKGSGR